MAKDLGGVWRTIGGRRVFIKDGEDLATAMKKSGKFNQNKNNSDLKNSNASQKEEKIKELEKKKEEAQGIFAKGAIQEEIDMLKDDFKGTPEEYRKFREEKRNELSKQKEIERQNVQNEREAKLKEKSSQLQKEIEEASPEKREQYEIIQKNNPMQDDYHTGIRSPKDIKTWEEAMKDEDSFSWGDFSKKDAEEALKNGQITVYSSYDIKQGTFVSTSKVQAEEYAGGKGSKVYEKTIPLNEVAWINGDEGQYAKIGSSSKTNNDFSIKTTKDKSIKDLYKKSLYKNGKEAGYIEYYDKNNKINIITMKTTDEFKRQGVASNLFDNLKEEKGDITYKVTAVLGDGEKFLESKTNIIKKEDRDYYVKIKSSTTSKTSNAKGTNSIYMKAYREYLKEHPNSKLTFKSFKEMNYN